MLDQARGVTLLMVVTVLTVTGLRERQWAIFGAGILGTLACLGGIVLDFFRARERKALKEEIGIHRRVEAFRRRSNQRDRL